ncbi:MAG: transposase [Nitrospirae bacterium]|nr:transposase [Nitrospirota bacterium]
MALMMTAYNLMSLFRQAILGQKQQPRVSTLRYRVFAIGSNMVKDGNNRILKLSSGDETKTMVCRFMEICFSLFIAGSLLVNSSYCVI